mgnify:CR=1 FL=1
MAVQTQARTVTSWQIDPVHTNVEFAVRHLMVATVRGRFNSVAGTILLDEDDITRSSVAVQIDAASIDTREPQRDQHLRSPDFLDVAQFPTITFQSKRIEPRSDGRYSVIGDLTIRGVTREVVLDASLDGRVKDPWGNERLAVSAQTTINRKDFGASWNVALEAGGWLVGDAVQISIEAEAVKQA